MNPKPLKALLQIPLFLLILYLGSVNLYEMIRALQTTPQFGFAGDFYGSAAEGVLEIVLLVWLYRWLGRIAPPHNPRNGA